MLHIKRFVLNEKQTAFIKRTTPVRVDGELDLSQFCKVKKGAHRYRLSAVVAHIGERISSGHFMCYAQKKGKWVKYNDSHKSECVEYDAFKSLKAQKEAYMLFYELINEV
jgi:ubiquitin C-terminal hydrolase